MARKRSSKIGGQAVIEGVMMKGERSIATAVRDESGKIVVESRYITPIEEKPKAYRTPFVRGVLNFFSTMALGMRTLMRSGEVFGGDEEPGKFEKWCAQKLKVNIYDVMMVFAVIIGVALALGLFFFLPLGILTGIKALVAKYCGAEANSLWYVTVLYAIGEGILRIIIFVLYIWATTLMKTVKRTYMYHGAEHKTISAYENDLELTVENVQKMTTVHDRCGTTFMFIIMLVSIFVFSIVGIFEPYMEPLGAWKEVILFASRIVLLPVIMGISYEMLKGMAKYDNWFVRILKAPGLALQKLTTKQPDDDMVECAITAFKTVMAMDADPNVPEMRFDTKKPYYKVRKDVENMLRKADASDIDWIFCEVLGAKRSELPKEPEKVKKDDKKANGSDNKVRSESSESTQQDEKAESNPYEYITQVQYEKIIEYAKKRAEGMPLWRVFGKVDFYGCDIKVTPDVLCPRPETEGLADEVIKRAPKNGKILDMCTGSGCIAIVLAKKTNCSVVASDVSEKALATAKENAQINGVADRVEFILSDMFEAVEGKYGMIVSNPPYIRTKDIHKLDREVKDYDPHCALDGGEDGLDFYRIFAEKAADYLEDGGLLALECGQGQTEEVSLMLAEKFDCRVIKDLEGVDRIVLGVKRDVPSTDGRSEIAL